MSVVGGATSHGDAAFVGEPGLDQPAPALGGAAPDDLPAAPRRGGSVLRRLRRRLAANWLTIVLQVAVFALVMVAWEFASGRWIDDFYLGYPSKAWDVLVEWARDGTLYDNAIVTLREAMFGFVIGCGAGVVAGFLLGVTNVVAKVLYPFVVALNSIPRLALAPLFLLWFGLGEESKVALVTVIVFFLVFFNTFSGVREVDRDLIDVLRVMGASRWKRHVSVTFPAALTWVVTGLRVSVPYAFVAAVVGEMVAAQRGLGMLIQRSSSSFNPSAMFAAIGVLVAMSLLINMLVSIVEAAALRWRVDSRKDST